jgi:serine/threonine protein kinase
MYKPLGKLGEGGFGKVYLVRRVTDGSEFAVKAFLKSKAFAG